MIGDYMTYVYVLEGRNYGFNIDLGVFSSMEEVDKWIDNNPNRCEQYAMGRVREECVDNPEVDSVIEILWQNCPEPKYEAT